MHGRYRTRRRVSSLIRGIAVKGISRRLRPLPGRVFWERKTNHTERFNNTLRQRVSRLVRHTLAFSKKLANHIGAIRYCICHDNLTRASVLLA
jgi:hypothetical protein